MTFKIPESKGSTSEGQFEFQLPGGDTVYRVPLFEYLTGEQMLLAAKVNEASADDFGLVQVEALFALFASVTDAPIRTLAMDQLGYLFNAWEAAGAVTPGESGSSGTSSRSTPKKSSTRSSKTDSVSATPAPEPSPGATSG